MSTVPAWLSQALELQAKGDLMGANRIAERERNADPQSIDALNLAAMLEARQGRLPKALALLETALEKQPESATLWRNQGNVLTMMGEAQSAIESFDRAISLDPKSPSAFFSRAEALSRLRRHVSALRDYEQAVSLAPDDPVIALTPALSLTALERVEEAEVVVHRVLSRWPRHVDAMVLRAKLLTMAQRFEEAFEWVSKARQIESGYLPAILQWGHILVQKGDFSAAVELADKVLIQISHPEAWLIKGYGLIQEKPEEALAALRIGVERTPDHVGLLNACATAYVRLERPDEAVAIFERVLCLEPDNPQAISGLAARRLDLMDGIGLESLAPKLEELVRQGHGAVFPFSFLSISSKPALHAACAINWVKSRFPVPPTPLSPPRLQRLVAGRKIRVGYLSSDFRQHAVGLQIVELFELHDRSAFQIVGFSTSANDESAIGQRIRRTFDVRCDLQGAAYDVVAREIAKQEIDILVDLNGHTTGNVLPSLAYRPAPVQVSYLGYPGTLGTTFIDYIIADDVVLPPAEEQHVVEAVVRMPFSYQVNDRKRTTLEVIVSRKYYGLPPKGFVFCSFNKPLKLNLEMIGVWSQILSRVPGSVLWLLGGSKDIEDRLWSAFEQRGVARGRVIFAGYVPPAEHVARQSLADLFLDSLPYNAHGTGSFALSAGLPLLTCRGSTFAGRVGASLLLALGVPELVTESWAEYVQVAERFATDEAWRLDVTNKVRSGRVSSPLFDTPAFARHIEWAYRHMLERYASGAAPTSFSVPAMI